MIYQRSLTGMLVGMSQAHGGALGILGEEHAATRLESAGYDVTPYAPNTQSGDLRAVNKDTGESINVEVKTSRRHADGRWRFTLRKKGHNDHTNADVVLLLAVLKSGRAVPFIVPVGHIADRNSICITRHPEDYAGRWARYRQRWGELSLEGCPCLA